MLRDLAHRPAPVRVGARDVLERGAARFALHVLNDLVRIELGKIDAGPARHQRQRAFGISVSAIVGELGLSLLVGRRDDHRHHREHENRLRIAAGLRRKLPDRSDPGRDDFFRRTGHEHAFGVAGREGASRGRGSRLVQDRRALRRRLGKVERVELVMRPIVTHPTHPVGSREHALVDVGDDSIVGPAALP